MWLDCCVEQNNILKVAKPQHKEQSVALFQTLLESKKHWHHLYTKLTLDMNPNGSICTQSVTDLNRFRTPK